MAGISPEQLVSREAFRDRIAAEHPNHTHLVAINDGIEDLRQRLASAVEPQPTRNFSPGALKDIERRHGEVFNPFKKSLKRLRAAKKPLWIVYEGEEFMKVVSRPTQVVIFPTQEFYVPDSNKLSLADQKDLLEVDSEEIIKKKWGVGGVDLVIGDVATHAALPFAYLERSGRRQVRLHGSDYGYRFARTDTPTVGSGVAHVGDFRAAYLFVDYWRSGRGAVNVWAVRLGVPAQE